MLILCESIIDKEARATKSTRRDKKLEMQWWETRGAADWMSEDENYSKDYSS
jgi:hypothetical protein